MTRETKVGLFVIIGIAMLMSLSAFLNNVDLSRGSSFHVVFYVDDGTGFLANASVKYRGLDVGKITNVEMADNGMIAIHAKLDKNIVIPDNAKLRLSQNGILGSRYAELFIQDAPSGSAMVKGGEYYNFAPSPSISDISGEIDKLVKALNASIGTQQAQEDIRQTLSNLRETTEGLKYIVNENQAQIASIITNIDKVAGALGGRSEEIDALVANFYEVSSSLRSFSDNLDSMLAYRDSDVNASLANIREITDKAKVSMDKIDVIAANLETMTGGMNEGRGTLGMLISDNETRDQLKGTVSALYDIVDKSNRMVIQLESGVEYLARHNEYLGNVNLQIMPNERKLYYFGVSNKPFGRSSTTTKEYTIVDHVNPANNKHYTEKVKKTEEDYLAFSIQYGYSFFDNHLRLRAGLFDSQLGFGVDWFPLDDKSLRLTFEASDFFRDDYDGYYRANARYHFTDNLYLLAGMDDIGVTERRSFSIGAGITIVDNDIKTLLGAVSLGSAVN